MRKIFLICFVVSLLLPVFVFSQDVPEECIDCSNPGGMVPCGRKCDDPTTLKNECLPCTLCDFFVMVDIIVDSIISGPLAAVLIIMIVGIIAMTAYARKGAPEAINKVKRALTGVAIGVIITYAAWVIVYMVLLATGAADWSGLDDLWIINCPEYVQPEHPELVRTFCGDDNIQRPNNDGFTEVCDGTDLGGQSCRTRGYESGDLACLGDCSGFDESACIEYPAPEPLSLPVPVPMNPEPLAEPPTGITIGAPNTYISWEWTDDMFCPENHVVSGLQSRGSDSGEWNGFWCSPFLCPHLQIGDPNRYVSWVEADVNRFCPENHAVSGLQSRGSDSGEWNGFWCSPLRVGDPDAYISWAWTDDMFCPENNVVCGLQSNGSDSGEWNGFWCCPLQ